MIRYSWQLKHSQSVLDKIIMFWMFLLNIYLGISCNLLGKIVCF